MASLCAHVFHNAKITWKLPANLANKTFAFNI